MGDGGAFRNWKFTKRGIWFGEEEKTDRGPAVERWESDSGSKGLSPGAGASALVGLGEKIRAQK